MPDLQQFQNLTQENNISTLTPIAQVAAMNVAFGNPKGDFDNIDFARLKRQCANILDEYVELQAALHGIESDVAKSWYKIHGLEAFMQMLPAMANEPDIDQIRDSLCDIQVFAAGAQHFMGVNGDDDITEVVGKVMTRFVKNEADKQATIAKHAANGITDVYFEGDYPTMVMKSASDQPDAPKGKFLKSASFMEPVFQRPGVKRQLLLLGVPEADANSIASDVTDVEIELDEEVGVWVFSISMDEGQSWISMEVHDKELLAKLKTV